MTHRWRNNSKSKKPQKSLIPFTLLIGALVTIFCIEAIMLQAGSFWTHFSSVQSRFLKNRKFYFAENFCNLKKFACSLKPEFEGQNKFYDRKEQKIWCNFAVRRLAGMYFKVRKLFSLEKFPLRFLIRSRNRRGNFFNENNFLTSKSIPESLRTTKLH